MVSGVCIPTQERGNEKKGDTVSRLPSILQNDDAEFVQEVLAPLPWRDYGVHEKTTLGRLRQLRDAGILVEIQPGSGRRAAVLCFPELLNIAEGRESCD